MEARHLIVFMLATTPTLSLTTMPAEQQKQRWERASKNQPQTSIEEQREALWEAQYPKPRPPRPPQQPQPQQPPQKLFEWEKLTEQSHALSIEAKEVEDRGDKTKGRRLDQIAEELLKLAQVIKKAEQLAAGTVRATPDDAVKIKDQATYARLAVRALELELELARSTHSSTEAKKIAAQARWYRNLRKLFTEFDQTIDQVGGPLFEKGVVRWNDEALTNLSKTSVEKEGQKVFPPISLTPAGKNLASQEAALTDATKQLGNFVTALDKRYQVLKSRLGADGLEFLKDFLAKGREKDNLGLERDFGTSQPVMKLIQALSMLDTFYKKILANYQNYLDYQQKNQLAIYPWFIKLDEDLKTQQTALLNTWTTDDLFPWVIEKTSLPEEK